jgi:hypothetical protein
MKIIKNGSKTLEKNIEIGFPRNRPGKNSVSAISASTFCFASSTWNDPNDKSVLLHISVGVVRFCFLFEFRKIIKLKNH